MLFLVFLLSCFYRCQSTTPAGTRMVIVSACPRCGTIGKSGTLSCCGRGGSWFKLCGVGSNAKLQHTWYEGMQACKARLKSKTATGHQVNIVQQKGTDSSQSAGMASYKAVIAASKTFSSFSINNSTRTSGRKSIITSNNMSGNVSITTSVRTLMTENSYNNPSMMDSTQTPDSTSITPQCAIVLNIIVHINLLFSIILFQ